jgi:hypothetical protein
MERTVLLRILMAAMRRGVLSDSLSAVDSRVASNYFSGLIVSARSVRARAPELSVTEKCTALDGDCYEA